jgi:hypothetical protein
VSNKIIAFISLCIFSFGCARNVPSTSQSNDVKITNYEEDLSAVRPTYETSEEKLTEIPTSTDKENVNLFKGEEPKNDNKEIEKVLEKIKEKNQSLTESQGFRISIFSENDRSGFESAKSFILQYYPELEIYESYSQPTYRVKVGDFMNRMDAERYYATLVSRFANSKIILDKIDVKKSLAIKQ